MAYICPVVLEIGAVVGNFLTAYGSEDVIEPSAVMDI